MLAQDWLFSQFILFLQTGHVLVLWNHGRIHYSWNVWLHCSLNPWAIYYYLIIYYYSLTLWHIEHYLIHSIFSSLWICSSVAAVIPLPSLINCLSKLPKYEPSPKPLSKLSPEIKDDVIDTKVPSGWFRGPIPLDSTPNMRVCVWGALTWYTSNFYLSAPSSCTASIAHESHILHEHVSKVVSNDLSHT